jgi:hypothetical protein
MVCKYAVNDDFSLFGSVGPYIAVGLFGKAKAKVDGDYFDFDKNLLHSLTLHF